MIIKRLKKLPLKFRKILRIVSDVAKSLNYRVYLVGGIVRDLILDRKNLDLDIVVEGDAIRLVKRIAEDFGAEYTKHLTFGTATLYFEEIKIDFATSRKEFYPHKGALPVVKPAPLTEDLFRRDFTINAMALSLNKDDYGKLIDIYGGFTDLKEGKIRVLHDESFLDDPTRIFRAIRFEQRFLFRIEPHTLNLLKKAVNKKALFWVNPHRLRDEIILILKEEDPYRYIKRIKELVGFEFLSPHLVLKQDDFCLLRRIKRVVGKYKDLFPAYRKLNEWIVYFLGIVHKLNIEELQRVVSKLGLRKGERKIVISAVNYKKKLPSVKNYTKDRIKIYEFFKDLSFESIVFLWGYTKENLIRKTILVFLKELSYLKLKVRGKDLERLGIRPKNRYGEYLKKLFYAKIKKGLRTKKEELKELRDIIKGS